MKALLPLIALLLIAAAPPLSRADRALAVAAAGFVGGKTCVTGNPGWPKSEIAVEAVDLNADGKAEVFVI